MDKNIHELPFIKAMENQPHKFSKERTPEEIIFKETPEVKKKYGTIECIEASEMRKIQKNLKKLAKNPKKHCVESPEMPLESPQKKERVKDTREKKKVEDSGKWNFEIAKREIKKRIKNQVGELQEIQHSIGEKRIRPFWEYRFNRQEKKLIGIGDLHYKALGCDVDYFQNTIDYIKKSNTAIILTGDLLENSTRYSVGAGVYEQEVAPMKQLYDVCEMLEPVKKQILAVISGNHEFRCLKESGFNPAQIMADKLNAPYCGFETFLKLWVKKQKYIVYATHGSSGARFAWTKMKALDDLMRYINADVVMMSHTHDCLIKKTTTKGLEDKKKLGILTGSFLRDEPHSYGVMKCYPPAEVGVVKVKLFGDRWDIHASK